MKAKEYISLAWYEKANIKAHEALKNEEGYNSNMYAPAEGVKSINDTYLLILLPQFENQLNEVGLYFKTFDLDYIKQVELD